jgi:putative acetyltransferase
MLTIALDNLSSPQVATFLQQHLSDMYRVSPAESVHALDLEKLKASNIKFWCAWQDSELVGCGALKILNATQGEIKSMRTIESKRRKGTASLLVEHIIIQAKALGLQQLLLETGTQDFFKPAHQLYLHKGFNFCGPFADYQADLSSAFMRLILEEVDLP